MATDPPPLRNGMTVFFFFFFFFGSAQRGQRINGANFRLQCLCAMRPGSAEAAVSHRDRHHKPGPRDSKEDHHFVQPRLDLSQNGYGPPPAT
mmetsp:Transcript_5120/g.4058  ORF Transcript_5120/g.4058 Transcript_5120/m.4058 type:complete len:92 (+) Transcript_5120:206-481(+)